MNPDLASLYLRGIERYDALDEPDRFRFDLLMRNFLTAFQGAEMSLFGILMVLVSIIIRLGIAAILSGIARRARLVCQPDGMSAVFDSGSPISE